MHREFIGLLMFLAVGLAGAQPAPSHGLQSSTRDAETGDPTSSPDAARPSNKTAAHISPPVPLIQTNPEYPEKARNEKINGRCLVAFTVDADGLPRGVRIVKSLDPDLDASAVQAVERWKFKPATEDGVGPIPFELAAEVNFQLLKANKVGAVIAIPSRPDAPGILLTRDGSNISPPVAIRQVPPKYPRRERWHRVSGDCTLKIIIDSEGTPESIKVVKSLDPGLDQSAIEAVKQWRYKPALKDGVPVPSEMTFIVKFQLDR